MLFNDDPKRTIIGTATIVAMLLGAAGFLGGLKPAASFRDADPAVFVVEPGSGFFEIVKGLSREKIIRGEFSFQVLSMLTGSAGDLKPGSYSLSPSMSGFEILGVLVRGPREEIRVTIPEGSSIYDVDAILSSSGIIGKGALVGFAQSVPDAIEGKLFPDTYKFFAGSSPRDVVAKFLENFRRKAEPLLGQESDRAEKILSLASLLEKEVPTFEDRRSVAGVLRRRLDAGMLLQVDATVCYAKRRQNPENWNGCYPLNPLDFKIDSPYNTYLYRGLPPGPIANPGTSSILAALSPEPSPYWFYLSDPETKETVFSETLDEHEENRVKYLLR